MPLFPAQPTACLALRDGTVFLGQRIGATKTTSGEVVFTTNMTGYQEVLTDPSYKGQIVTMTYPLQGNYGFVRGHAESRAVAVEGFVVTEACATPSTTSGAGNVPLTLHRYLESHGIPGITGIDTRALVRHIRDRGAVPGLISTEDQLDVEKLKEQAAGLSEAPPTDLVTQVRCAQFEAAGEAAHDAPHCVAVDFGMKKSILRLLTEAGFRVTRVPAGTAISEIEALNPDALFLSNGPGDPQDVGEIAKGLLPLIQQKPTFGICLGHQLLGLAFGAETFKLHFGHRGGNHPVRDEATGRIYITTQNHGYAVDADKLGNQVEVTHLNLNDQTVSGLKHKSLPVFSVQFHPEAGPGPHDARTLFKRFRNLVDSHTKPAA